MMINQFLPKRPDVFQPTYWQSEAASVAADAGYKHYCESYYDMIGHCISKDDLDRIKAVWQAERDAKYAGMWMQTINLQSYCEKVERQQVMK